MFKFVQHNEKCKFVGDLFGGGSSQSNQAPIDASQAQLEGQKLALAQQEKQFDWQKGMYEADRAQRQGYLNQLGDQSGLMSAAQASPLYQAQLGQIGSMGQKAEGAALRNRSATGGLRGGGSLGDIASIAEQQALAESQALGGSYANEQNRLMGLAGLIPTMQAPSSSGISNLMSQMGQTQAQGIMGAAQTAASGQQQGFGNLMGLGNMGMQAFSLFSDARLKTNLVKQSETSQEGVNNYTWTWNDKAYDLGLSGDDSGYLAQEIEKVWPELVHVDESGYKKIDAQEINKRVQ